MSGETRSTQDFYSSERAGGEILSFGQIKSIVFILLQWTLQSVQSTSSVLEPSFTLSNSNMLLNVSLKG